MIPARLNYPLEIARNPVCISGIGDCDAAMEAARIAAEQAVIICMEPQIAPVESAT